MSVRVGLIGAGVMGADHAWILATSVSGAELVAVSDPDAARAAKVLEICGTARAIADPLELIRDDGVDAILVASPDRTHGEFALACLDIGKPVLCEKPLAASLPECLQVIAREQALGRRLLTVGYMRRFDPGYVEMKRRLDEGDLGAALVMHCVHRNVAASPSTTGAMLIANSAVHEFDIARFVLGREVRQVTVVSPRNLQDPKIVLLEMDDGVIVDAEIFINARYGYDVRAELVCEAGTITLAAPHDVTVRHADREGFAFPGDWRPRFASAYRAELQAWIGAVRSGVPVGASAWDGYVATAIASAGVSSLASGRPVEVRLEARAPLYD